MVASVAIEPLVATACARCVATDASGEASAGEGKRQALEDLVPMHGRPQRVSATGTRVMPPRAPSHTSSPSSRRPGVVGPETVIVNRADRPGASADEPGTGRAAVTTTDRPTAAGQSCLPSTSAASPLACAVAAELPLKT